MPDAVQILDAVKAANVVKAADKPAEAEPIPVKLVKDPPKGSAIAKHVYLSAMVAFQWMLARSMPYSYATGVVAGVGLKLLQTRSFAWLNTLGTQVDKDAETFSKAPLFGQVWLLGSQAVLGLAIMQHSAIAQSILTAYNGATTFGDLTYKDILQILPGSTTKQKTSTQGA